MVMSTERLNALKKAAMIQSDRGLGESIHELAENEGYIFAIRIVEDWRLSVEAMAEICKPNAPVYEHIMELFRVLTLHMSNLLLHQEMTKIVREATQE